MKTEKEIEERIKSSEKRLGEVKAQTEAGGDRSERLMLENRITLLKWVLGK